jgi:hypothetical protein
MYTCDVVKGTLLDADTAAESDQEGGFSQAATRVCGGRTRTSSREDPGKEGVVGLLQEGECQSSVCLRSRAVIS